MDPGAEIKRQLGGLIAQAMKGWNQHIGAAHIGIRQGELSELMRGKLQRFSLERLLRILARLDYDIEVHVRPTRAERPRRPPPTACVRAWDRFGQPLP